MKNLWPALAGSVFAGTAFTVWALWYLRKDIWR